MTEAQIKEALKLLEDDDHYYGEFGRQFLSNSDIRTLQRDPLSFGKPNDPHVNLLKGNYFHKYILEPEKAELFPFVEASNRNTNIYKAATTEENPILLLKGEVDELKSLADKLLENPTARDLIRDIDVEYEVPGIQELAGEWWKLKADIKNNTQSLVVDLKTTSNIEKFSASAQEYNYDSQAYIYSSYFGYDFVFVVADKLSGQLGIFDCSPQFLDNGRIKVEQAVDLYRKYTDKDFDPKTYYLTMTL